MRHPEGAMSPKVPRAIDWRPPTDEDIESALPQLDRKKLWKTVREGVPGFTDLSPDDQIFTVARIAWVLLQTSLAYRSNLARPKLATMRKNIRQLRDAIEATRAARKALDVVSGMRITVSAGDYRNTPQETVVERGFEQWARFDEALRNASIWATSALNGIPSGREKKGPPYGLDILISDLAEVYENSVIPNDELRLPADFNFYSPGGAARWDAFVKRLGSPDPDPEITRSFNKGGFLDFATKVVALARGFDGVSKNQVEDALRRIIPRLSRKSRSSRASRD
jgi:hypothetical protein